MFGSAILDTGIGIILIFLLLSFIATAVREGIEGWRKARAAYLEKGIVELLGGATTPDLPRIFYEHPLIGSLYQGDYTPLSKLPGFPAKARRAVRELVLPRGRKLPTYIPAKNFAGAIIDLAFRGTAPSVYAANQIATEISVASIRANAYQLQNPRLVRALLSATDFAGDDISKVRDNLQDWFDASMDRVSGWYKRATQVWLFVIGFGLAAILNVQIFRVANALWRDKSLRETIAARAAAIAQDTAYRNYLRDTTNNANNIRTDVRRGSLALTALDLPIGWSDSAKKELRELRAAAKADTACDAPKPDTSRTAAEGRARPARKADTSCVVGAANKPPAGSAPVKLGAAKAAYRAFWFYTILAYVLTALAVTLGAPFWFDVLNKFIVIRSTVKPHEKSPEEGSEDRQKNAASTPVTGGTTTPAPTRPASTTGPVTPPPIKDDPNFEPHEWAVATGLTPNQGKV